MCMQEHKFVMRHETHLNSGTQIFSPLPWKIFFMSNHEALQS